MRIALLDIPQLVLELDGTGDTARRYVVGEVGENKRNNSIVIYPCYK